LREYYYTQFGQDNRPVIIGKCRSAIRDGRGVIYIAPSREVIFDVRRRLTGEFGGMLGIFVGGFDDLEAQLVREKGPGGTVIDDATALAALGDICRRQAASLSCFAGVAERPGFVRELHRAIRRLKRLALTPEAFAAKLAAGRDRLDAVPARKCRDILNLYSAYQTFLAEKGLLDVDDISLRAVAAADSSLLAGAGLLVVDGYINIDPVSRALLQAVVRAYPALPMVASIPFRSEQSEPFLAGEILHDLGSLGFAAAGNAAAASRDNGNDLQRLAQDLFAADSTKMNRCTGLSIGGAPSREDEVRQAARQIKQLLYEGGETPREIAVVLSRFGEYQADVLRVCKEMGIPVNLGWHEPLVQTPLYKDFASLLRLCLRPLDGPALLNAAASPYFALMTAAGDDGGLAAMLDLIGRQTGVLPDLTALPAVIREWRERNAWDDYGLAAAVDRTIAGLETIGALLAAVPETASRSEHLAAAALVLEQLDCDRRLLSLYRAGRLSAELLLRDLKAAAAIRAVLTEMEQIDALLTAPAETEPFSAFLAALASAAERKTITRRQPSPAGVRVLDPDLLRGVSYRHVFFLGLNEGFFPRPPRSGGLFSRPESSALAEFGLDFGRYEWELQRERIRFSAVCAAAGRTLRLSWRTAGEDGSYMVKSPCIEAVQNLLSPAAAQAVCTPSRSMRQRFERTAAWSASEARENAAVALGRAPVAAADQLRPYLAAVVRREGTTELEQIRRAGLMELSRALAPEADEYDGYLPGRTLRQQRPEYRFSASQLNSYLNCPYRYYLERVLGLSTSAEDTDLSLRNEGTVYHAVLKQYYEEASVFDEIDAGLVERLVSEFFRAAVRVPFERRLLQAKEMEMRRILAGFIAADRKYLSGFAAATGKRLIPVYFELSVQAGEFFGGRQFAANIDRVDLEYDGAAPTGRFVLYDYKRGGGKSFRDCVLGRDCQLLVYYYCLLELLRREKQLGRPEAIALYFYNIKTGKKEGFVRDDYKGALGDGRKQNTVSPDAFDSLMGILREKAMELVDRIRRGEFVPPAECGAVFFGCNYAGICRHDPYRLAGKRGIRG
jgi:ATP-dependent helicase/nuclease subunit B